MAIHWYPLHAKPWSVGIPCMPNLPGAMFSFANRYIGWKAAHSEMWICSSPRGNFRHQLGYHCSIYQIILQNKFAHSRTSSNFFLSTTCGESTFARCNDGTTRLLIVSPFFHWRIVDLNWICCFTETKTESETVILAFGLKKNQFRTLVLKIFFT